jgi:hypothetical protein
MASVHSFNEALAQVRGVPRATIEAYSRVLRRDGLLPKTKRGGGATPATTVMAGYMLAAVMRGSPTAAAENAREVGDLIVHDPIGNPSSVLGDKGPATDPILDRQLAMFGWSNDMSFARVIGWLLDRYVDGTIGQFIEEAKGIKISVDRYWTMAHVWLHPAIPLVPQYIEGYREAFKTIEHPPLPRRRSDGSLDNPMPITFHTPLRYEMKMSYGVNKKRNRDAGLKYHRLREEAGKFDKDGVETVTHKTLIAIAEVFK